ncbi:Probable stress-associated endoplasmic reticulum protein [Linum perenne]
MTTSMRVTERKNHRFQKNITKRGSVSGSSWKKFDYPVGPIVLGFIVFVVVGSCLCFRSSGQLLSREWHKIEQDILISTFKLLVAEFFLKILIMLNGMLLL